MRNWLNKNYKILIILAFLIPIVIVAIVSISHVTVWYGISNPMSWAMYLSLGVEIAALSALAAISASMGRNVYFPFIIVTIIQFIGNIFFSYQYIDINSKIFKDWVDLVSPLISSLGVEEGDMIGHRRFLALFSGGLLPLISLSFLHMLVKFSEDARLNKHNVINDDIKTQVDDKIIEEEIKKRFESGEVPNIVTASDIIGEVSKVRLSEEELKRLESILLAPQKIEEEKTLVEENKDAQVEESYDSSIEEGGDDIEIIEDKDVYENEPIYENLTSQELNDVVENDEIIPIKEEVQEEIIQQPIDEEIETVQDIQIIEETTPIIEEKVVEPISENIQTNDEIVTEQVIEEEKPTESNIIIEPQIINNPDFGFEKKN